MLSYVRILLTWPWYAPVPREARPPIRTSWRLIEPKAAGRKISEIVEGPKFTGEKPGDVAGAWAHFLSTEEEWEEWHRTMLYLWNRML
jgi:hypothetical protein